MRPAASLIALTATLAHLAIPLSNAQAVENRNTFYQLQERDIPQAPSAPPSLSTKTPQNYYSCDRNFLYRGKLIHCDSMAQQDAEGLRNVVKDTPQAVTELDDYQYNRRTIRNAAYIGTTGILIAISGLLISQQFTNSAGGLTGTGIVVRNLMAIGGVAIAGGSFIFAIGAVKTNEYHIGRAVQDFNSAHPSMPIQLQFSTGISFY